MNKRRTKRGKWKRGASVPKYNLEVKEKVSVAKK
jgi:hypothetical protein